MDSYGSLKYDESALKLILNTKALETLKDVVHFEDLTDLFSFLCKNSTVDMNISYDKIKKMKRENNIFKLRC